MSVFDKFNSLPLTQFPAPGRPPLTHRGKGLWDCSYKYRISAPKMINQSDNGYSSNQCKQKMSLNGSVLQMLLPTTFRCTKNSFARSTFILTITFIYILTIVKTEELKLKLVQLVIRHGDRSPIQTYSTDPWSHAWPDGLGQLTPLGMRQQYDTGQYLRNRYEELINDTYNYNVMYVRSTNFHRNLNSASANLAGFFPPEGAEMWEKRVCWEPVPIHTVPLQTDHMLSFFSECPAFEKLYQRLLNSSDAIKIGRKYRDLFKFIAVKTRQPNMNLRQVFDIADATFVQKTHNLTVPDWVNETIATDLENIVVSFFTLLLNSREMCRLRGGPLLGELINTMQKVVDNRSDQHKLYMFLSHDITIVSIFSALNIFEPHTPPYCSTVMIELLEGSGDYFVKIMYRNDTTRDPYELSLKDCPSPCPFDTFKTLIAPMVPADVQSECGMRDKSIKSLYVFLIRHGDRSPTLTFPTDQWKNVWPDGFGQLTKLGIQQQFLTGKYLRHRYGTLINNTYNSKSIYVRSTNADRTLMSASSNLAGFLPPRGSQIWNKNLMWQPIPVHTLPEEEDYILSPNSECPKYDKLYNKQMRSPEAYEIRLKYGDLYKYLSDKTELYIKDFHKASEIYDTLFVQQTHKLTLPDWTTPELLAKLRKFLVMHLIWLVKTFDMRRLRGGPLIGEMVKHMQTNIWVKADERKIYMYSAHDNTIASFLSALDVFDPQVPPYCSMVMLELFEGQEMHFVKVLYRNDTTREPYELTLKDCSNPCPFDQFINLTAGVIPKDIKSECLTVDSTWRPDTMRNLSPGSLGIQQQFSTGKYLEQRYGTLFNNTYYSNSLYVQSSDYDRTLTSAYVPPRGNLIWQPIPVHALPIKYDHNLSNKANCTKYKIHNLTMPDWVNQTVLADLAKLQILQLIWASKTHAMRRFSGGTFDFYVYSRHNSIIAAFLIILDVFGPQMPPYCSMVMIELLEEKEMYYVNVKILYRNNTTRNPYELALNNCSNPCLSVFIISLKN
uniref:acid phosphatase n=1 Tax=Strigamia maritima TaxID=126957 RepID=T1JEQ9_STRMM